MKKSLKNCALCLTTICLTCSPACCQTGDATTPAADALRIRAGWTATSAGYYLSDTAMRDTIAGWTTARKEADIRQQALEALRDEIAAQTQQMRLSLAELQREIVEERKLWRGRVRRGKAQGLVYGVIGGFVGGYFVRRNNP
ncbi:MAG: hypothetical protein IJ337_06805 [Clostridia bacterium]|nr:hypothetical protein [Clostridia bacterium]